MRVGPGETINGDGETGSRDNEKCHASQSDQILEEPGGQPRRESNWLSCCRHSNGSFCFQYVAVDVVGGQKNMRPRRTGGRVRGSMNHVMAWEHHMGPNGTRAKLSKVNTKSTKTQEIRSRELCTTSW